jgi:hypothetical protein
MSIPFAVLSSIVSHADDYDHQGKSYAQAMKTRILSLVASISAD